MFVVAVFVIVVVVVVAMSLRVILVFCQGGLSFCPFLYFHQVLREASYMLPFYEIYHHKRDETQMLVLHNPYGAELHNHVDWHQELHSNMGFRWCKIVFLLLLPLIFGSHTDKHV